MQIKLIPLRRLTVIRGYHIDSVFIDGINVGHISQYTIANITSNKTISVKFGLNDTTKYRSFKSDSLLSLKSISLKRKAGQSALLPLKANWRDTVIFRYGGKRNHSRIAQTDKVLARNSVGCAMAKAAIWQSFILQCKVIRCTMRRWIAFVTN